MLRFSWLLALAVKLLCGCGRVGFDVPGAANGDGGMAARDGDGGNADALFVGDAMVPSGLVAWYRLDEDWSLTTQATDSSGNGHHGACTMCPTQVAGRTGGFASRFVDRVISIAAAGTALDLPTFTVTAWVRPEIVPTAFETIVARPRGGAQANSWSLDHISDGRVRYFADSGSSLLGMTALPLGAWSHVAIAYDGTFKYIYFNTALEGSGSTGTTLTYDSNPLQIGADAGGGVPTTFFTGAIQDVMIFDRRLTNAELDIVGAN